MDDQTWRVVLESGEVLEVLVTRGQGATPWSARGGGCASCDWRTPREAVVVLVYAVLWPAREILAPGEFTRVEASERARRDGVLHGLTVAREHAVAVIDGGTGLPAIDWVDVVAATGDALAASKVPA